MSNETPQDETAQAPLPVDAAQIRMVEAVLFAAEEPLDIANIKDKLPEGADVPALLAAIDEAYATAGFNLQ